MHKFTKFMYATERLQKQYQDDFKYYVMYTKCKLALLRCVFLRPATA